MSPKIDPELIDKRLLEGPQASLERRYIREYLLKQGYQVADLRSLPREEAKKLMSEACQYASLKLAEVESRTRFWKKFFWSSP